MNAPTSLLIEQSFNVEFEYLYFKVEILRKEVSPGAAISVVEYFADVYLLRWPYGATAFGASTNPRMDATFRQSWLFLDDFRYILGSSPRAVYDAAMQEIASYGTAYLQKFDAGTKRPRPK